MEFSFEGFATSIHWLLIALLFVLCIVLALYTYKSSDGLKNWQRYSLISLRSSVFIILLLVLLNPQFLIERTDQIRSQIAVIFDHSESVTIEKGEYEGMKSYNEVFYALNLEDSTDVRFNTYAFDRTLFEAFPDTLAFDGSGTNISMALRQFLEEQNDEQAVIFISDGIFNVGRDPAWQASRFPIPIYTIAIGDTSRLQDIIVQDVIHNEVGYTNTRSPITATIVNDGLPGRQVNVQLRQSGNIIDEKNFTSQDDRAVQEIRFEVELEEEGLQQYEIYVPEVEGEWTTANNSQSFTIEVLDDRVNIMLLSFEIHPDIRALRSLLREDESIALDYRTWLGNDRFVEGDFPSEADSLNLIILHGFPQSNIPSEIQDQVASYTSGIPLLWLASPKTDFRLVQNQVSVSPFTAGRGTDLFDMRIFSPEGTASHPIMELPEMDLRNTPTLNGPIRNINADSDATILLRANYRGTETDTPVLLTRTTGNVRSSFLTAFGWYQWYLTGGDTRNYTEELFNNIVKWTSTSDDESLLRVRPARNVFQESENVIINAFLRNESGAEEDGATLDVSLTGEDIGERQFTMANQGLGQYRLQVGNLSRGNYNFDVTARKDGRVIDERSGAFSIGSTNLEFINTIRNDELLRYMADESGGVFFEWQSADQVLAKLQEDGHFEQQTVATTREIRGYQHPVWFILMLLLLTGEWIIRKIASLP